VENFVLFVGCKTNYYAEEEFENLVNLLYNRIDIVECRGLKCRQMYDDGNGTHCAI
jgi:hypothetical protein